jgi:predicted metal-binding protein
MADDVLFVCNSCKTVWENESRSNKVAYYEDFPTIGKKRKECPKCKNQSR